MRKLTVEEQAERIYERFGDSLTFFLETYKGSLSKPHFKCNDCGHEFDRRIDDLLNGRNGEGRGCSQCGNGNVYTKEAIADLIYEESDGKLILNKTTYTRTHNDSEMHCNVCGNNFEATPHDVLNMLRKGGSACPYCSLRRTPSASEVNTKIKEKSNYKREMIEDTYKNCSTPAQMHCLECDYTWWVAPKYMYLYNCTCSFCTKKSMEKPVYNILKEKKVMFKYDKTLEGCYYPRENEIQRHFLRADFRFEKYPLIIETDGRQHFEALHGEEEFKEIQERDAIKNKWCKEHGYILIRVTSSPTHEWGTERHITLKELLDLIEKYITEDGVVDIEAFQPYDFNRD